MRQSKYMAKYAAQRIGFMLLALFIITFMCFVLIRLLPLPTLSPTDPHAQILELKRKAMGYDEPIIKQFGIFLKNIFVNGDWGVSEGRYVGQNVTDIFVSKLPPTMLVNLYSILISIPIGLACGIFAALKKNTWVDYTLSTATMVVISVPSFVYAFLLKYFLYFKWDIFPPMMELSEDYFSWSVFWSMIPAVLSLSFGVIAGFTRTTRAELTEVLTSEFMLLARTKGLTRRQATIRHALKNCAVVIVPMIFGQFIGIMSGSLIIEKIFTVPGVGQLYLEAVNAQDYNMFMLLTVFYTAVGLTAGIITDISYGFIDPRIRMGSRK